MNIRLYKRENNKVITWSIDVIEQSVITITHGEFSGVQTITSTFVSKGKNIGKSNETTPYTQALKEATAKAIKKQQRGYKSVEDLGLKTGTLLSEALLLSKLPKIDTDNKNIARVMKAIPFKDNKIDWNVTKWIAQRKLNGVRCFAMLENNTNIDLFNIKTTRWVLRSKEGLEYKMPKITAYLETLVISKDVVLDGELYCHDMKLNEIRSCIPMETKSGGFSNPSGNPDNIQFWIFDLAIPNVRQTDRLFQLSNELPIPNIITNNNIPVGHIADNVVVTNDEDVRKYAKLYIEKGFEGVIIRHSTATYQFGKRSNKMRKLKKYSITSCIVLNIIEKKISSNRVNIVFELRNDINNEVFEATPLGNNEDKRKMLQERLNYINNKVNVKYYERSGIKQVPFHGNVVNIKK